MRLRRTWVLAPAAVLAMTGALAAQQTPCWIRGSGADLDTRPSKLDSAQVTLGGASAKLCYSRPSARGREVMGALVPYGRPWRLGANEATTIHLPFAAEIGGVQVPAGSYTLYAIPGETEWEVVVNRAVQRWGIPINDAVRGRDAGAATVAVERLAQPVETLTLTFAQPEGHETSLVIEWERTRVRVPIRRAG
jgi:hypothetical protein